MKKIIVCVLLMGCVGITMAAQQTLGPQEATKTGLTSLITKVNAMMAELYGSVSTNSAGRLAALEVIATNATIVATELDAATAAPLLIGKATATGVTIGASDANTIVAGDATISGGDLTLTGNAAKLWLGTNGFFAISGVNLLFVSGTGFTNTVISDITQ